jgi:hypothetical protein
MLFLFYLSWKLGRLYYSFITVVAELDILGEAQVDRINLHFGLLLQSIGTSRHAVADSLVAYVFWSSQNGAETMDKFEKILIRAEGFKPV